MTYKINPIVEKINAPIQLFFPDGSRKRYIIGEFVARDVFDKNYQIMTITAIASEILITLEEAEIPSTNWIGEEQTFF